MKVSDLMEVLARFHPEAQVVIRDTDTECLSAAYADLPRGIPYSKAFVVLYGEQGEVFGRGDARDIDR